jgi:hypothetical protein
MIQHPRNISDFAKANACFYMFVDEETEAYVKNTSSLYNNNKIGLWRLVVVRNLPYEDPRRTGKVPFLLVAITINSSNMCFYQYFFREATKKGRFHQFRNEYKPYNRAPNLSTDALRPM